MIETGAAWRETRHSLLPVGECMFYLTLQGAKLALNPGETLDAEDFDR